jgi:hypothetical protein
LGQRRGGIVILDQMVALYYFTFLVFDCSFTYPVFGTPPLRSRPPRSKSFFSQLSLVGLPFLQIQKSDCRLNFSSESPDQEKKKQQPTIIREKYKK